MDAIEHWLVYDADGEELDEVVEAVDARRRQVYVNEGEKWRIEGPFVRADACRGAVGAVQALLMWIDVEGRNCPSKDTIDELLAKYRLSLHQLGGRYAGETSQ